MFVRVLPFVRAVLVIGRDRHKDPFVSLAQLDPQASPTIPFTSGGRELRVTWGGWFCKPQITKQGAAIGRLWVEWD